MTNTARRASGDKFPCASLAEALPHLRRPPTPAAARFKIQNTAGDAAQVAAYLDARLVFERLDQVCGAGWSARFEALPSLLIPAPVDRNGELREPRPIYVRCRLTLFGVTREDVGEGQDPKAAFSDAVKRAAVHFGIGRALYAMRLPWLREGDGESELRRNRAGRLVLDRRTEAWCREQYGRWLRERGSRQFGEPLDHGDETGAPGFEAEGAASSVEAEPAATDQGHGRRAATGGRPVTESKLTPELSQAGEPPVSPAPEGAATVRARLVALSDGSPGGPPATALDRKQIAHWRQAGRYKEETITALAGLACGERILERLTHEQVRELAWLIECAVRGRVSQRTLAGSITRLERKSEEREVAVRALRDYLQQKAREAELLGRRKAA